MRSREREDGACVKAESERECYILKRKLKGS